MSEVLAVYKIKRDGWVILDCGHWYKWTGLEPPPKIGKPFPCPICRAPNLSNRWPDPTCPCCGSTNGSLGTSYAYFMCGDCNGGQPVYWTADHQHPGNWEQAIAASPWARARLEFERAGFHIW